jgi:hypothetical protein
MILPSRTNDTMADRQSGDSIELAVAAFGAAGLGFDELARVRREPPNFAARLAPQLLKRSDEQTLASLVALERAISSHSPGGHDYSNWAVLSASRYLGRSSSAALIDKYPTSGPWGVSVHSPAHFSPHAVASTVSLALGNCGPSIGVGGGPGAEPGVLLAAVCLLQRHPWEGCWVLLSGWSPELEIRPDGSPKSASQCLAVALGLVRGTPAGRLGQFRVRSLRDAPPTLDAPPPLDSAAIGDQPLVEFLQGTPHQPWRGRCGDTLVMELDLTLNRHANYDGPTSPAEAGHQPLPSVLDPGFESRASRAIDRAGVELFGK